ncbi:hypothetical protein Z967_11855 [Clostridium novyi A str. 4540]|uniref:BppU family phage baseplate upper protein n=1 Tax=Clostridium novyi TaxID=1542 RepID=UPI0004DACD1C|nr:BppU family phage baseplate upper protein [Clostridium novyi]KEH88954.1 hypothetical protein Z967_11855 [Clostridium novyi A str. 4540]
MDKIFNLKIDTKNKNITTVTGLKQFDNNSVLNITLLQNSLALDLSNCTVRINFLREDERVLLYMGDIVNSKEGKFTIKLSPEVLEKYGLIKADISVFDSNLLKITSTTFNLKVDKAIYDDTYFTEKDLDLMQQEYVREKQRQQAENTRKANETARVQAETKRNSNENTRNSNEEARKKAETARVAEWNNVKKDANNIKNTLETTTDTANTANSNLQNTINNADKLKQELTPSNYVKNADYEKYKKEVTTQYEDTTKALNDFGGRNYLLNSDFRNKKDNWITFKAGDNGTVKFNEGSVSINNISQQYCGIYQPVKDIGVNVKKNYIISFYAKADIDSSILCGWTVSGVSVSIKQSDDYIKYSINIGSPRKNGDDVIILYNSTKGSTCEITKVKVEVGYTATDWNISPEEVVVNSKRLDAIEKILIEKGYITVTQKL